jgi:PAS domain S-box-containing protein
MTTPLSPLAPGPSGTPAGEPELFRALVNGITDYAIFLLSPQGIISSWNAGAQRIKGYQASEIIGQHFSRFYPAEANARGWPDMELKKAAIDGRFEDEGWRLRKDGSRFWANVIITTLRSSTGELIGFSKITRDLTERRAQEEALRQSEENFRLLIEGVKDHAIFLLDPAGTIISWNAGAERVGGFSSGDAMGQNFAMLYSRNEILRGKPQQHLDMARGIGFVEETGWRVKRDGSRFWAFTVVTALRREDGSLRGFATVIRDLSENRRVMELESEGRRINEFIAMLAHELRNPLAPIRNAVGVLEKQPGSPQLTWCGQVIGRQVDHLARLVDDLLEVSRITSGKILLERVHLDLNNVMVTTVESMRPTLEAAGHRLEVHSPDEEIPFTGDPIRLSQVIVNLLTNAGKYTPRGGHIEVTLERLGGRIYLRVRDDGIGMTRDLIENAFDLFVQGDRALDRAEGGLGIGLTLVKRISAMHGGTVTASSAGPNQGSEFVVSLPAPENAIPPVQAVKTPSQSLDPRNILVVDDNVDAAQSLTLLLGVSGHNMRTAHDGSQALELAQEHPPDLILLDIGLPGMDGYEVARRVRKLPELKDTRLVAMTGYGQQSDKAAAAEAGFDAYLVKPVEYSELVETIESLEDPRRPALSS